MVSEGLSWVAQQPHLPDLSVPDLIGLTREGGLVVAELKRGPVTVATLSQALHYVLVLGSMEAEAVLGRLTLTEEARSTLTESYQADSTPDFSIMLVGTGRLPELDRAAAFLAARGLNVPVRIVTFTPFIGASGDILLTRYEEDHELEAADLPRNQQSSRAARIEWVQDAARELGVGGAVEAFMQTANDLGLGIKPWPKSLTMVPPFTRGKTLLYIKPSHQGAAHFGYSVENLTELYGADSGSLVSRLGSNWVDLSTEDVKVRLTEFALLMKDLQHPEEATPVPSI